MIKLTTSEQAVIVCLITLARHTHMALDDSEEFEGAHGRCHSVSGQDFDDMCEALDFLDELPDDRPGLTLAPGGKAEWALRRLLCIGGAVASQPAALREEPDWDEVRSEAETATGLPVERHTFSIIQREIRKWLIAKERGAQHHG